MNDTLYIYLLYMSQSLPQPDGMTQMYLNVVLLSHHIICLNDVFSQKHFRSLGNHLNPLFSGPYPLAVEMELFLLMTAYRTATYMDMYMVCLYCNWFKYASFDK